MEDPRRLPLDPLPGHRLTLARIAASRRHIPPEFLDSPQYECEPLSEALGCHLTLKLDFTNPIRSFKGRGASFLIHELSQRPPVPPLVCASAGNWGQALAYACRRAGLPLTVYASVNANALKVARMKALGARVIQEGEDFDAAKDAARQEAQRTGGQLLEDGLDAAISEGHGTIAMELLAHGASYDAVSIPIGNGALFNGMARWFKAAAPATCLWGVCAAGAPSMERSWRAGRVVETPQADSIADGIAVRVPIAEAVRDMEGLADDVLLVEDQHIAQAMRLAWDHAGVLLEPAGAAGLAAIVAHTPRFTGQRVATVLCGSNATPQQIERYLVTRA